MRVYHSQFDPYHDWIMANYSKYTDYASVAKALSKEFNIEVKPTSLRYYLNRQVGSIVFGVRGEWTESDINFLKENYTKGVDYIVKNLGRSKSSVVGMAHRLGVRVDTAHQPQRSKLGTIRIQKEEGKPPRLFIKVSRGSEGWMNLSRYVYTWHNGPIPDDGVIIFLDGDSTNCHISNLYCGTPLLAYQITNNPRYKSKNPEITRTLIKYYELRNALGLTCDDCKNLDRKFAKYWGENQCKMEDIQCK